mmetsp:Transcript_26018/g.56478  ORF Transcript_26018/g.56478 Transcript_26018/m.56478 type:complete len:356 (+) Transcript_26018:67-1134(+)
MPATARKPAKKLFANTAGEVPTPTRKRGGTFGGSSAVLGILTLAGATILGIVLFQHQSSQSSETPSEADSIEPRDEANEDPKLYSFRIVKKYRHDSKAFTQGLLWLNGSLYESLGLYGRSGVREVALSDEGGYKVVREAKQPYREFGEGLAYIRGELVQLLWQPPELRRWSVQAGETGHLEPKADANRQNPALPDLRQGWGLTADDKVVYATDSGSELFELDPDTFAAQRRTPIRDRDQIVEMVNELEVVEGEIWGNVFGQDCLARIDPSSGKVLGWIDLSNLMNRGKAAANARAKGLEPPDVLNGIAYDPNTKRLFVTGKLWPRLYEIEVIPHPHPDLQRIRRLCIPTRNLFRA